MQIIINILKFIISKIFSFFIYLFCFLILLILIFSTFSVKESKIYSNYSNLIIENIDSPSNDKNPDSLELIERGSLTFKQIIDSLKQANVDNNIQNIFINLDNVSFTVSQIEEIKTIFENFKTSGKKIIAYGSHFDNNTYALAMIADEIIAFDTENVDFLLNGYQRSSLYYKDFLDKYGVNFEVIHIGDYKNFGEAYKLNSMSEFTKKTITRIFDKRLNDFIENFANNRKLNKNIVENKLLNGDYSYISIKEARDLSIIDKIMNLDDIKSEYNMTDENSISINDYYKNTKNNNSNNSIAVIYLEGNIEENPSSLSTSYISYENVKEKIELAKSYNNLSGIVIRINSSGGSAYESKRISDLIKSLDLPVYISIADTAASGGYYIASAGDKIFINNSSITGSIGVVSIFPKVNNAINKLEIKKADVSRGKHINLTDPFNEINNEDREKYRKKLELIYEEFKNDILEKRTNLTKESLEKIAQGQIWLGSEALENGLVDEIGDLETVISSLANDYQIENYSVIDIYSQIEISEYSQLFIRKFLPFFNKSELISKLEKEYNFLMKNKHKALYYSENIEIEF